MTSIVRISSKEAIIEAAFIVCNRDSSASLSAIANRAGVGRATLHRYFSSRDDLMQTLSHIALKEMDDAVEAACADVSSYSEAVHEALEALIPLGDRHGFVASGSFELNETLETEIARQNRETIEMIEGAKKEGLFDRSVPTAWIVQSFDYLLYAAWESVKAQDVTKDQAVELAWRTLTRGLGAEPK